MKGRDARCPRHVLGTALIGVLTLWFGLQTAGCSGSCREVESLYDAARRREVAEAGSGLTLRGNGQMHLGVTVSESVLQELIQRAVAGAELRGEQALQTAHGRESVQYVIIPKLDGIELLDPASNHVRIQVDVEIRVTFFTRPRVSTVLFGDASIDATLSPVENGTGGVVLRLAFEPFVESGLSVGVQGLDEVRAQGIVGVIGPRLTGYFEDDLPALDLVLLSQLRIGALRVGLGPVMMEMDLARQALFVGLVSNLRPTGAGQVDPSAIAQEGQVLLQLHPGIPAATMLRALVEGRVTRRFDQAGAPDPEGDYRVTYTALALGQERFTYAFDLWSLAGECGQVSYELTGLHGLESEGGLEDVHIDALSEAFDTETISSYVDVWPEASFVGESLRFVEEVLDYDGLVDGQGEPIALELERLSIDDARVSLALVFAE